MRLLRGDSRRQVEWILRWGFAMRGLFGSLVALWTYGFYDSYPTWP